MPGGESQYAEETERRRSGEGLKWCSRKFVCVFLSVCFCVRACVNEIGGKDEERRKNRQLADAPGHFSEKGPCFFQFFIKGVGDVEGPRFG